MTLLYCGALGRAGARCAVVVSRFFSGLTVHVSVTYNTQGGCKLTGAQELLSAQEQSCAQDKMGSDAVYRHQ